MNNIKLFFICLALLSLDMPASAQPFQKLSYEEALKKAAKSGKMIFLLYESNECTQCNEVADKAFENVELGEQLTQAFICIKIKANDPEHEKIGNLFNKKDGNFGCLFINKDGSLVHSYGGSTSMPERYKEEMGKALVKAGEGIKLAELEAQYNSGNHSPALLELLMNTRKSLNLETDALLDQYTRNLPADSFNSARTLQFIATMAPELGSYAYVQMRKNKQIFSDTWKTMELPLRVNINHRIGLKSIQKAIKDKNEQYALQVARFTQGTYTPNSEGGRKAFDEKMLAYYYGIHDTATYIRNSIAFYDKYLMTISIDSIRARDSVNLRALLDKQPPPQGTKTGVVTQKVGFAPSTQRYNYELIEGASNFYKMTNNPAYLEKALAWSFRANEFYDHYISLNTTALLLYKLDRKQEAFEWQEKAIKLKKKHGMKPNSLETELENMKKGEL